ncbi:hypothetical protein K2X83_01760 [Patescibacteria group bacterium]|nr:hypothetical protein [Patescibacteria group bacterium]
MSNEDLTGGSPDWRYVQETLYRTWLRNYMKGLRMMNPILAFQDWCDFIGTMKPPKGRDHNPREE